MQVLMGAVNFLRLEKSVPVSHQECKRSTAILVLQEAVLRFPHRIVVFVNAACRMLRKVRRTNPKTAPRHLTVVKVLLSS
jgi:hypothetical protein